VTSVFSTGDRYLHYIYLSPINHAPAWLFGILTGYLLYRHGSTKIQIPKKTNLILWSTSFFVMTLLLLSQTVATRNSHNYFFSAVLNSLARPLWSLAVCFMIFSCSTGHGGKYQIFKTGDLRGLFQVSSTLFSPIRYL
jgi:hypothetical protein